MVYVGDSIMTSDYKALCDECTMVLRDMTRTYDELLEVEKLRDVSNSPSIYESIINNLDRQLTCMSLRYKALRDLKKGYPISEKYYANVPMYPNSEDILNAQYTEFNRRLPAYSFDIQSKDFKDVHGGLKYVYENDTARRIGIMQELYLIPMHEFRLRISTIEHNNQMLKAEITKELKCRSMWRRLLGN